MKMALVTNLQPKKQLSAELKKFGITANQTSAVDSQAYVEGLKAYTKSAEYAKRLNDFADRLSPTDVRRMIITAGYGNTRGSSERSFKKAQKDGYISSDADFTSYWTHKLVVEFNNTTIKALQQVIDQGVKAYPGKTDFTTEFQYVNHFYIPGSISPDGLDNPVTVAATVSKVRREKNKMLASKSYYATPSGGFNFEDVDDTVSKYAYKNRSLAALHNLLYTLKYKRGWEDAYLDLKELASYDINAAIRAIEIDGWDKWFDYDSDIDSDEESYRRVIGKELAKIRKDRANEKKSKTGSNKSGT